MTENQTRGAIDLGDALVYLWQREYKSLSADDLKWLSGLGEKAEVELRSLADVLSDAGGRPATGAHAIGDDAISGLMFTAANVARNAAAMVFVAGEADYVLTHWDEEHSKAAVAKKAGGAK